MGPNVESNQYTRHWVSRIRFTDWAAGSCFADTVQDPNDSSGPIDIGQLSLVRGMVPLFRIRTRSSWSVRATRDRAYFVVFLDTRGDADPEYQAQIRSNGRSVLGTLFSETRSGERPIGPLTAGHPTGREAVVRVPLALMRFDPDRLIYRWSVETIFNRGVCPNACFDLAPEAQSVPELRHPAG